MHILHTHTHTRNVLHDTRAHFPVAEAISQHGVNYYINKGPMFIPAESQDKIVGCSLLRTKIYIPRLLINKDVSVPEIISGIYLLT